MFARCDNFDRGPCLRAQPTYLARQHPRSSAIDEIEPVRCSRRTPVIGCLREKRRLRRTHPYASLIREVDMAYYVILANFTDQGVRTIKESPKRADAFKAMAQKSGVKIHALYWTLGQHDIVTIVEANDDVGATALSLSVTSLGNIRTQTQIGRAHV